VIEKEDQGKAMQFMKVFHEWLQRWQLHGLSMQTFGAAIQTTASYGHKYVLTGHIQADFIEGRFGWFRQLSGANYYNSVVQMLQAEKRIRIRSLVHMNFNFIEIKDIFVEEKLAKR
jgi:hypothetical protein